MEQIVIFEGSEFKKLQNSINRWLEDQGGKINIVGRESHFDDEILVVVYHYQLAI